MPSDFLREIVEYKKNLLAQKKDFLESVRNEFPAKDTATSSPDFREAVSRPGRVNLIAEIKKASPSRGVIRDDFHLQHLAQIYVDEGAAAISVLTDEKFFQGRPEYIKELSQRFAVPLLTKDFIIDELQIYEARGQGASAVLLIAAILSEAQMRDMIAVASHLGLDCLVEVHNEQELESALAAGAEIVGINNRDLHTFTVDFKVSEELLPRIPEDKVIVVESGIKSHEDVRRFTELGAHAVLIGETFMSAPDVRAKVREVMYGR